ncbi:uncharacterized protein BDFB_009592, partial [Asbolus verrucosus]
MLKTIFVEENIDISKYPKLQVLLKRMNDGHKPKKSNVFSREEVNQFFAEALDNMYLLIKLVTVKGIAKAYRSNELCKMKLENVKERGGAIIVAIPDSKNEMFTIISHEDNRIQKSMRGIRRTSAILLVNAGVDGSPPLSPKAML